MKNVFFISRRCSCNIRANDYGKNNTILLLFKPIFRGNVFFQIENQADASTGMKK